MNNVRTLSMALLGLALSSTLLAASPWSVRLAATYLETTDGSSAAGVAVEIQDKLIPEFDISYAFTPNWSADLVLTIPQKHDVKVNGVHAGTFKHLPPTLLAKYSFDSINGFTPYVGAGLNVTLIFGEKLGGAKLDDLSIGAAGQIGFDYKLSDKWSLNADLKHMMLRTDVKVGSVTLTEAQLDPWLYSIGARRQF
jgi:outer membrane protein